MAALRPGDQFDPPGRAAIWKASTRDTGERAYGHWLRLLGDTGLLDAELDPAQRCTPANLDAYLPVLRRAGLASHTVLNRIHGLNCMLHAMCPRADLSHLDRLVKRLARTATPVRNKLARIVSPSVLYAAAATELVRLAGNLGRRPARRYRDLLIVALLARRPIRLTNLAAITFTENLEQRNGLWHFRFEQTKTDRPIRFPLPQALAGHFGHYLTVVRPFLLRGRACDHLWVTGRGGPASEEAIYEGVNATTEALVGHRINPHLFRDIVATFVSEEAPEDRAIVADILGHAALATSQMYYDHAGSLRAQQRLVAIVDRIVGDDGTGEPWGKR